MSSSTTAFSTGATSNGDLLDCKLNCCKLWSIPPIPPSESSVAVLATVALVAVADVVTAATFSPTVTCSC